MEQGNGQPMDRVGFPRRSLSRDLTVILAVLMAVVMGTLLAVDYFARSSQAHEEARNDAEKIMDSLAYIVTRHVLDKDMGSLSEFVDVFAEGHDVNVIRIFDSAGDLLFETPDEPPEEPDAIRENRPLVSQGKDMGRIEAEFSLLSVKQNLQTTFWILVMIFLAVMALLVAITSTLMRSCLRRPLAPLETDLARVARGEFDTTVGAENYEEFNGISKTFAIMVSRLKDREETLRAEIADRKSAEERYFLAVQGANDGIWDWDLVSGKIHFSRRWKEILGFEEDEFPNDIEEWKKRIHPEDRQRVVDDHHNFMAGLVPTLDLEYRLRHKDGSWRVVHAQGASLTDERGEPIRIAGANADITERCLAQQALEETKERFRILFEQAPDAIFIETHDGRILDANAAASAMLGYSREELRTMTVADIQAPEVRDEPGSIIDKELTFDTHFESLNLHKDGTIVPVEVHTRAVRIQGKEMALSVVRDISERKQNERKIKERDEHYRAIVESYDGFIYICDKDYRITFMNDRLKERNTRNMVGELCHKAVHGIDDRCAWCVMDDVMEGKTMRREVHSPVDNRWYYVVNTPIFNPDGTVSKQSMFQDITERKEAEQALRDNEERYRSLIETTAEGFALLSLDLTVQDTNEALCDMLGRERSDIIGRDLLEFMDDESREVILAQSTRWEDTPHRMYEFSFKRSSGEPVDVLASSTSMFNADGKVKGSFVFFTDISDRKRMENQLRYQAMHDPLTGLSNRTLCLDRISRALERARRRDNYFYAVIFLDLDRFKVINDSLGHTLGDQLLVETSHRLLECVRDLDTVSRFGGDEFIILLEELGSPRKAIQVVKRMRQALRRPYTVDNHEIQLTASIGIVLGPTDFKKPEDILQYANIAMHRAKSKGRDRFKVFTNKLLEHAIHQMALENHMERAMAQGEFFLNYQPIIRMGEGSRLYGFEALARWDHPSRGIIPPDEFIPVAEETGMIMDLGLWVLAQAGRTMVEWMDRHPQARDLILSVNISGRQFSQHDLATKIRRVLDQVGLSPHQLKLEITETAIMENAVTAVDTLRQLKELGITLSVDDFGTGYSSMSYLQRLPLDNLKIDLSFIQMLDLAPENIEIVKAIISLAHTLELEVVAEGVERLAHQEILVKLDCDYCQGYLYARPMKAENAEQFILNMDNWELPN